MVCHASCVPVYMESLKKKAQNGSISFCYDTTDLPCAVYRQDQQEYPAYFVDFTVSGFLRLEGRRLEFTIAKDHLAKYQCCM